ncbi:MAG: transcription termination factor NusA [Anaerolineae bacterium]
MKNELIMAINNICIERELEPQVVFDAIENALVSAHRKRFGTGANVRAQVDQRTGEMKIFIEKEVVEDVTDDSMQISLAKARAIQTTSDLGDIVLVENTPKSFGRIAAQTAKQVILQRIREAERDAIYQRYQTRVGEIVHCTIRSVDFNTGAVTATIDGKAEGLLTKEDQIPTERYRANNKLRCYLVEVERGARGPAIRLSRTHRGLLRRLLEQEVPEIYNGTVEIKSIAREPGQRSKVAVAALQSGVDPVGSCVGMRGVRIQAIVNELNGEKIDVIEWNPDPNQFIASALSPAKVSMVILDDTVDNRTAIVVVPDKQLSLAIGKEGQNARLSAKLTGWRIDIKSESEAETEGLQELATELNAKRARMAMARARAESEDILSVAEQLLSDDLTVEAEAGELDAPYADEYDIEYAEMDAEAAIAGEAAPSAALAEGEIAAEGEAVAEVYDEYDEYADYGEYNAEAATDELAYDEYAVYDEYADYEGLGEFTESDFEEYASEAPAPAAGTKSKGKKAVNKGKKTGYPGADRRRKHGRADWLNFDE